MTDEQLLIALNTDLGITATAYDTRLAQLLTAAKAACLGEGATGFDPAASPEDAQICVMYAGWLWRQREAPGPMPRMLRWALNNRVFSAHAAVEGS